jgi:hypothetical protein
MLEAGTPGMEPPLLSFFIPARNDAYMGDSNYRLAITLNSLGRAFAEAAALDRVEALVCDWGSARPLAAEPALALSSQARAITRFVTVPPQFARAHAGGSEFPETLLRNVCIRRAAGRFLAATNADILFTRALAARLLGVLDAAQAVPDGKPFVYCSRTHVPLEVVREQRALDTLLEVVADPRAVAAYAHDAIPPSLLGPIGDLLVLPEITWREFRGYDERLIHWGWLDIDVALRAVRKHRPLDLAADGGRLYHLEHYGAVRTPTRKVNEQVRNRYVVNKRDANWGFASVEFPIDRWTG